MPEIALEQRTRDWWDARRGKVTASVAGACLGLDPKRGPYWAYREITGAHKTVERYGDQAWGVETENNARESFERQTGLPVRVCGFHVHADHPWLGASPDFLTGDSAGGEIKCPQKGIPERIPIHDRIQCLIGMACTGRKVWFYLSWTPEESRLWVVKPAGTEGLIRRLKRFYDQHVVPKLPPPKRNPAAKKKRKGRRVEDHPLAFAFPFEPDGWDSPRRTDRGKEADWRESIR